jgi:hypothetical protein
MPKPETPSTKIQTPKEIPNIKHQTQTMIHLTSASPLWSFDIGASLELGAWDLELSAVMP